MTNRPMNLIRNDADRVAKEDRVLRAIAPYAAGSESVPITVIARELHIGIQSIQDILLDLQLMGHVVQLKGRYRYRLVTDIVAPAPMATNRWQPGSIAPPARERLMGRRA